MRRFIPLLGLVIAGLLLANAAMVGWDVLGLVESATGVAAGGRPAEAGRDHGVLPPSGGDGPGTGSAGAGEGAPRDGPAAEGRAGGDAEAGDVAAAPDAVAATGGTAPAQGRLLDHLDAVFRRHGPPGTFGVAVVGPQGRLVWQRHADRPLIPASTQKVVTAALALQTLGADHRFTTEIRATGPVRDGVVHGDVLVVGGGDPALGGPTWERVLPQRPRTPVERLAARVAEAGVREVRGQVIGVDPALPWQPQAPGWPARYLANADAVRSSGLTVNGGLRLRERAGRILGQPADSPALQTARVVAEQLVRHDVAIAGQPGVIEDVPGDTQRIATIDSPPVGELLRYTLRHSDNHLADTLWRMAGRRSGDGSWQAAGQAATAVLADLGLPDPSVTRFVDGSGLSRDNRVTARQLALLDQRMTSAHGAGWDELKALAGVRGTLRRRLHGTVAAGELYAKTGSLRDVRALVGSVDGPQGRWHLAILANDLDRAAIGRFRRLRDDLAVVLARDTQGCPPHSCRP